MQKKLLDALAAAALYMGPQCIGSTLPRRPFCHHGKAQPHQMHQFDLPSMHPAPDNTRYYCTAKSKIQETRNRHLIQYKCLADCIVPQMSRKGERQWARKNKGFGNTHQREFQANQVPVVGCFGHICGSVGRISLFKKVFNCSDLSNECRNVRLATVSIPRLFMEWQPQSCTLQA